MNHFSFAVAFAICFAVVAAIAVAVVVVMRNRRARLSADGAGCPVALTPGQAESRGLAWVLGAFVICPCHLPLTLGLAAAVLSGTAAGALLSGHLYIAGTVISLVWLAATWHGIRYMRSARSNARLPDLGAQR
jgi:hypothetical protein